MQAAATRLVQILAVGKQVKVRVDKLLGKLKVLNKNDDGSARPSALYASGDLCASKKKLGLTSRTPFAESDGSGASWGAPLIFPIKVATSLIACVLVDPQQ